MALLERRKNPSRYRLVEDGEVVAAYPTKRALEEALRRQDVPVKPAHLPHLRHLHQRLELISETHDDSVTRTIRSLSPSSSTRRRGHSLNPPRSSRDSPPTPSSLARPQSSTGNGYLPSEAGDPSLEPTSDTRRRSGTGLRRLLESPLRATNRTRSRTSPAGDHHHLRPSDIPNTNRSLAGTDVPSSSGPSYSRSSTGSSGPPMPVPITSPRSLPPRRPGDRRHSRDISANPSGQLLDSPPSLQRPCSAPDPLRFASRSRFGAAQALNDTAHTHPALQDIRSEPTEVVRAYYYDDPSGTWRSEELVVRLASKPFASGAMREAFRMDVCHEDGTEKTYVAKRIRASAEAQVVKLREADFGGHPPEAPVDKARARQIAQLGSRFERQLLEECISEHLVFELREFLLWLHRLRLCRVDCEMQGFCQTYAAEYNKRRPPKPVWFLDAFLVVCTGRPNAPVFACEPLVQGKYVKYNNNAGEVPQRENERNTPQAFSHFSYERSGHQYVIIDIQGVGDTYTDPQVHSADARGFGLGNLGQKGIDSFLETHRCNNICIGLKLAPLSQRVDVSGTVF